MGAVAGKVMPRPRGPYDATAVYDILDMVTLDNKLWVAKRSNIQGVEPAETNEYWMLAVDGTTDVNELDTKYTAQFNEIDRKLTEADEKIVEANEKIEAIEETIANFENSHDIYDPVTGYGYDWQVVNGELLLVTVDDEEEEEFE